MFSHPGDFTPGCTTEFVAFQNKYKEFKKLKCELIGLSVGQVYAHLKWEECIKDNLKAESQFPLIADTGAVAETLGLIPPGKGTNTVRVVFVVDAAGVIRIMLYYPQELGRNIDEVVRVVKAMQTADKHKVAMPADWPKNEMIKDRVIVPPASSVSAIKDRITKAKAGEIKCLDWWFCHKKLGK